MIILKNRKEIAALRDAGRIAAIVRNYVASHVAPGITTAELSELANKKMKELGAESAFLNYRGFPGIICVSVNDEVVHGIPGKRRIAIGDVVSIDIGVRYCGFIGDTATTVIAGISDTALAKLVSVTEKSLYNGIKKAVAGNHVGDISYVIEKTAKDAGFNVVRQFVGHGVGRNIHEEPEIPNFGEPATGPLLKEGMVIAIEPMLNMGGWEVEVMGDGWTVKTADGSISAHFEHMVSVGKTEAEILTK